MERSVEVRVFSTAPFYEVFMNNFLVSDKGAIKRLMLSVAFLIISSKVSVPLYPVPITLQMFAVYFLGLLLSPRESFVTILSWLLVGSFGLPAFASNFGGPTTGYLLGMLFGAPVMGFLKARGYSNFISCIACYLINGVFGCFWLSSFVGFENVIQLGIAPFVIPELLKITLICAIFNRIDRSK